jgi:beta-glucosidase
VPALIHAWCPGQFGGLALGEILFGDVNPFGKLPITLERRQEDNPAFATYPKDNTATAIPYSEGLFVGYRGYEKNGIQPLFPFGHGLSYTRFRYSDVQVRPQVWAGDRPVEVTFTVTNVGKQAGAETAQVYLGKRNSRIERPLKELEGFAKVFLETGNGEVKPPFVQLLQCRGADLGYRTGRLRCVRRSFFPGYPAARGGEEPPDRPILASCLR